VAQHRLLSVKHEQEISNYLHQWLAEKEFSGEADETEGDNKKEQKKDYRADFRLHVGHPLGPDGDDFINIDRESARRDKAQPSLGGARA
jgi:hypothetical protein